MCIRQLTLDDLPTLAKIDGSLESNRELHVERIESEGKIHYILKEREPMDQFTLPPSYAFEEGDASYFTHLIEDRDAWGVAIEVDEQVVGYCLCLVQQFDRSVFIESIYIDRRHRGKGYGRTLMDGVIGEARRRNLTAAWLKTESSNLPACRFYERCGFRIIGVKETIGTITGRSPWQAAIFWGKEIE